MQVEYLEPPDLGVEKPGWYVVENNRVLAGPFDTKDQADNWIQKGTINPPGIKR